MNIPKWIKPLYIAAGLYDGILGAFFLVAPLRLFRFCNVAPPNHIGYVQFPAMLLIIFAVMFFSIARNPSANRNLIFYGILLKFSYCSVVFFHRLFGEIPAVWMSFAYIDLAGMFVFIYVYKIMHPSPRTIE